MVVRLSWAGSVTAELYHCAGAFVERSARPGRRLEGPGAEAEREHVRDRAELLHLVLGEGRRLPPQQEAAAGLADAQEQARLEAALDVLRVLGLPRVDARDLAQPGPLRFGARLDRPRPELALVLEV